MAFNKVAIMGDPVVKEYKAHAAVTPGHLLQLNTDSEVQAHASAGGTAQRRFALEDEEQGVSIATAYTANTRCKTGVFKPGDEVYALLKNGEHAYIGYFLESAGDGTLQVSDQTPSAGEVAVQNIVGVALEAVDMSGSSGVDPSGRIRIEIM
jgi:hypothetical protein